jgi:hypothetical protein
LCFTKLFPLPSTLKGFTKRELCNKDTNYYARRQPVAQSFGPKSFEFSFGFHIVIQIQETRNFWMALGRGSIVSLGFLAIQLFE